MKVDGVEVTFHVEKSYFNREMKTIVSRPQIHEGVQVTENSKMLEDFSRNACSSTCHNGARRGTRTPTRLGTRF